MTEHEKLVEQVARVICFETGSMGDPMPIEMQRVERDWQEHTTAAKAAIFAVHAALQEPSGGMIHQGGYHARREDVYSIWQAMLDASPLKEKNNG